MKQSKDNYEEDTEKILNPCKTCKNLYTNGSKICPHCKYYKFRGREAWIKLPRGI